MSPNLNLNFFLTASLSLSLWLCLILTCQPISSVSAYTFLPSQKSYGMVGGKVFSPRFYNKINIASTSTLAATTMPRYEEDTTDTDRIQKTEITETGNVIGLHGAESRFLSLSQLKRNEFWPRIIPVAGSYPGLSKADLLAPESQPSCEPGQFSFDFTDPEGPQLGTVALPGSELVYSCIDPVVVVAENLALGIQLQEEVETLVLIDRGQTYFNPRHFFAFAAPDGAVVIRYFNDLPQEDGWQILGRVMYVTLPHVESTAKASGFLEEEDDD